MNESTTNWVRDEEFPDDVTRDEEKIERAFWRSLAVIVVIAMSFGVAVLVTSKGTKAPITSHGHTTPATVRPTIDVAIPKVPYLNITEQAGIKFKHFNGAIGEKMLPETMGGGVAFFDFDNDGDPDILLVNSCRWSWDKTKDQSPPTMALYRNEGAGRFSDVTAKSGLDVTFYGMGVACGDYDNDGLVDVFITAVGKNHLFKNLGGGKFQDVTNASGVGGTEDQWTTSAAFLDYDNDGQLDLFVCQYVKWSREKDASLNCTLVGLKDRAYCGPKSFEGTFNFLYHNEGKGRFKDVSKEMGMQVSNTLVNPSKPLGKSLGVAPIDLDDDGWIDIVVANDTTPNFLFKNVEGKRFEEMAMRAGVAVDPATGNARGGMGIDAAKFRNDGAIGIAIANFANEQNALFVSQRQTMVFSGEENSTGFGPKTRLFLKFGLFFFDTDLDGRLDILLSNGHLEPEIQRIQESQTYEQAPQLFWNCGEASDYTEFTPLGSDRIGSHFLTPIVGRGATYADIDNDGDLDVLLTGISSPPRLLRNDQQLKNNWIRLKLVGTKSNKDAIGAWVKVTIGKHTIARQVMPARSYLSQVELPITIGLGTATAVEKVEVIWPKRTQAPQTVDGIRLNQTTTVIEK